MPLSENLLMRRKTISLAIGAVSCGILLGWLAASGRLNRLIAAETTPAAAPATSVTSSTVLPLPEKPLGSQAGLTYQDSRPGKIETIRAPQGAPNIVIVLLDDVGFGAAGT